MPRPRARSLFELGGQWIAIEPGRAGLYRFWNDARTGRTCRASLGTEDLGEAKLQLAEIVIQGATKTADSFLSVVLETYFTGHSDHVRSKGMARRAGVMLLEKWGTSLRASAVDEALQKEFAVWAVNEQGYAISYVERIFGVLAAALEHNKIKADMITTEGTMLTKWPELAPKPERDIYEPCDEELARLLRAPIPEDLRRWVLNSMATGGRPEAVLQLMPGQRQRDLGLLHLNHPDRRQNKKYRSTVRELAAQGKWLDQWEKPKGKPPMPANRRYCGYASVDSIDTALRRARDRDDVNIPGLTALSFRNRVASVLRASKQPRVPGEQISYQLGHKRVVTGGEARTTRVYGQFGPDYLAEAAEVLEAWVTRVLRMSKKKAAATNRRAA